MLPLTNGFYSWYGNSRLRCSLADTCRGDQNAEWCEARQCMLPNVFFNIWIHSLVSFLQSSSLQTPGKFMQLMWPFLPKAGGPWESTQGFAIRKQKWRYSEVPIKPTIWLTENHTIEQVKCFKYSSFEKQQHLCRSCCHFKIPWSQEEGSVPVVLQVFHTKSGLLFQFVSYKKRGVFWDPYCVSSGNHFYG